MAFTIEWKGTDKTNFSSRGGAAIAMLVLHITAGSKWSVNSWFNDSSNTDASAGYMVTKQGEIWQYVKDGDKAWHAGIKNKVTSEYVLSRINENPNAYSIGIEFESFGEALTPIQLDAGAWLINKLCKMYNIPINRVRIIGHYQIDAVNRPFDPGPNFQWDELMAKAKGGITVSDLVNMVGEMKQLLHIESTDWFVKDGTIAKGKAAGLFSGDHREDEVVTFALMTQVMINVQANIKKYVDAQIKAATITPPAAAPVDVAKLKSEITADVLETISDKIDPTPGE